MKRIHIIGGKNHGKTTLVVELVQAMRKMGLRVGTIKHTHHHHELDTPGKDSHRHREAGAEVIGICSPAMNAVFWPGDRDSSLPTEPDSKYAAYGPWFEACDIVLVEGDSSTTASKVEVWRAAVGAPPLAAQDPSIAAVITDDVLPEGVTATTWSRSDVAGLVSQVLALK